MPRPTKHQPERGGARTRLLNAALQVIREKGFSATSVDELCAAAGVTKGAFFHHFENKEALGVAAANHWTDTTSAFFETAPYHDHDDPLERVLAYVDFRKSIIEGDLAEFTCLVGTMAQEIFNTHASIRDACAKSILAHSSTLESDIADAIEARSLGGEWSAESLARHTQAVIQGGFILAKATGNANLARESVDHLKRYLTLLFQTKKEGEQNELH